MSCTLCGKKKTTLTIKKGRKKIDLCHQCAYEVQKATFVHDHPIVWVDKESLMDRYEGDVDTLNEIQALTPNDYADIANEMADSFWNDQSMGDWWSDNLCTEFEKLLVSKEEEALLKVPLKDLPLQIGTIKHKENEKILEQLLKNKEYEHGQEKD
jgi:hypothetical protein